MLKIAFHPLYVHPLPKGHRFPMEKYELVPQQLLHEGTCTEENFFEPDFASESDILAVHEEKYFRQLQELTLGESAIRKIGFPLSERLVAREILIAGGTIQAAELALKHGIAMNIAGGTHHAYANRGEGFCLLNDQAIAARALLNRKLAEKILIVDLDVHQGNGTAKIFENDPSVFTFSMHGKKNYPFEKEGSNLDIELDDGMRDKEYLKILKNNLPKVIEGFQPDFIFYLCGVDILSSDKLGRLDCTIAGCKERDRFVLQTFHDLDIPVQCSMGGGYSPEIKTIIDAHANTFRLAQIIWS